MWWDRIDDEPAAIILITGIIDVLMILIIVACGAHVLTGGSFDWVTFRVLTVITSVLATWNLLWFGFLYYIYKDHG